MKKILAQSVTKHVFFFPWPPFVYWTTPSHEATNGIENKQSFWLVHVPRSCLTCSRSDPS